jgi:hypothetical protein
MDPMMVIVTAQVNSLDLEAPLVLVAYQGGTCQLVIVIALCINLCK